ncbi:hypothetical protein DE146DRAFT_661867 [Phaeosphaeria sp. MPI-PUGE-AT-0046c]|nr:hypothetical protein DE146DRAFT_661867 [Phaeosphaeria sp. MPI-PUGE-AT-0046c]
MSLLTLPPELFLHVTNDVIEACGISAAWKLRGVCRTFAENLTYEILNRPTSAFVSTSDRRFFRKNVHRYLAARLHNVLNVDRDLIQKVRDMATWAASQLGTITEQQREDVAVKVCAGLERTTDNWELVHALECTCINCPSQWQTWSQQPLDSQDKLIAVVAICCYDDAADLLADLPRYTYHPPGIRPWMTFRPLEFDIRTNDDVFLNVSLQYLARLESQGFEGIQKLRQVTSRRSVTFNMRNAIGSAITHKNLQGLQVLLDFYRKHLSLPDRHEYDIWIHHAMVSPSSASHAMQSLSILLNYKPHGVSLVDKQIVGTACQYGTVPMVHEVLKHAKKDINTGTILTLPIFIAVRSGRVEAVNGVIDAGADPNVIAVSNMSSVSKRHLTALELAMHRNCPEIIDALLQRGGGPIPHISEWTTHRRTYDFLRRKVLEDTGKNLPTLKAFRRLTQEEREALVH